MVLPALLIPVAVFVLWLVPVVYDETKKHTNTKSRKRT